MTDHSLQTFADIVKLVAVLTLSVGWLVLDVKIVDSFSTPGTWGNRKDFISLCLSGHDNREDNNQKP